MEVDSERVAEDVEATLEPISSGDQFTVRDEVKETLEPTPSGDQLVVRDSVEATLESIPSEDQFAVRDKVESTLEPIPGEVQFSVRDEVATVEPIPSGDQLAVENEVEATLEPNPSGGQFAVKNEVEAILVPNQSEVQFTVGDEVEATLESIPSEEQFAVGDNQNGILVGTPGFPIQAEIGIDNRPLPNSICMEKMVDPADQLASESGAFVDSNSFVDAKLQAEGNCIVTEGRNPDNILDEQIILADDGFGKTVPVSSVENQNMMVDSANSGDANLDVTSTACLDGDMPDHGIHSIGSKDTVLNDEKGTANVSGDLVEKAAERVEDLVDNVASSKEDCE
eukprot:TRINITY_DN1978_c0_g4_i1.p1 TRINITY_DN1978_c0_g4~~TRINITY_DN1978_c0_g4_i1.p1  ORF type:complete len:364 (-),score=105.57 TRINITY_DN1978_c0_g4_i1:375-1391(-)